MTVQQIHQRASLLSSTVVWLLIRLRTALTPRRIPTDGEPQEFPINVPSDFEKVHQVNLTMLDLDARSSNLPRWKVCCLESRQKSQPSRTLVYLHGGAYIAGIQPAHWKLCAYLTHNLKARVVVIPYPLIKATVHGVMDSLVQIYSSVHEEAKMQGHEVIVAGDSAGGGLSVGLVFALLHKGLPSPDQLLLISPWLDVSNSVPEIENYQRADPWLRPERLLLAGQAWSAGDIRSPYCSPLFGDLTRLTKAKVKVTLCAGTYDYLYTNALEWVRKCGEANLPCLFISAERSVHVYPLLAFFLPSILVAESVEALRLMVNSVEAFSGQ